jgi:hypothetical protein
MAQYKVLQKSFINNNIVEEGEIVEYDGKPGTNLEPMKSKRSAKPLSLIHI